MKVPIKVKYKDCQFDEEIDEYAIMPSGKIVVMINSKDYPESLWFYSDGNNPKSYLEFDERNEFKKINV